MITEIIREIWDVVVIKAKCYKKVLDHFQSFKIPCQRLFRRIDRACFLRRETPNAFRGCVASRTSFGKTDTKTVWHRHSVFSTFSDFSLRGDERRDQRSSSSRRHTLTSSTSLPSQSPSICASESKSRWYKRKFFCKWVETDVYYACYNVSS